MNNTEIPMATAQPGFLGDVAMMKSPSGRSVVG